LVPVEKLGTKSDLRVFIEKRIVPMISLLHEVLPLGIPGAFVAMDREVDWTCIRDTDCLFDGVNTK